MKKIATGLVALCLAVIGCESKPATAPKTPMTPPPGSHAGGPPGVHTAPANGGEKKEEAAPADGEKKEAAPADGEKKEAAPADGEKKDEEKKEEAK